MKYSFIKLYDDNEKNHRMIYECETKYHIVKDKEYVSANLLISVSDKDLNFNILANTHPVGLPKDAIYDVSYGMKVFASDIKMVLPDISSIFEDKTKLPIIQVAQNGISFLSVEDNRYQSYVLTDKGNIKETINDDRSNPSIVEFTPTKETFMWMKNLYFFMESLSSHFEK